MNPHVTNYLHAYYDGELQPRRQQQVAAHLAECQACRQALAQLGSLSAVLAEIPAHPAKTRPEQFVAQVGLRLPRTRSMPLWPRVGKLALHLVPAVLFLAVAFIKSTAVTNNLLASIGLLDLGGESVSALLLEPQLDFSPSLPAIFPDLGIIEFGDYLWNNIASYSFFGIDLTHSLVFPLVLGGLAFAWMVIWWLAQKNNPNLDNLS
ncbi:MAG: zf-HC2 domain-containing protein [Anaerolineae bacterium]|nr:zf-HC2 domain-containing protein [Anaerolineae bacterium]